MTDPPGLRREDLDDEGRALYDTIVEGPRSSMPGQFAIRRSDGTLAGPFGLFLLAPAIGAPLQELGAALRTRSVLEAPLRELATLAVAATAGSRFELAAHLPLARAAGVSEADIRAVLNGGSPAGDRARLIVEFARAGVTTVAPRSAYEALGTVFDEQERFEVVALVGYYRALATMLELFGVEPTEGDAHDR
jgi:4-carboxymuconolactone decarboxylase